MVGRLEGLKVRGAEALRSGCARAEDRGQRTAGCLDDWKVGCSKAFRV